MRKNDTFLQDSLLALVLLTRLPLPRLSQSAFRHQARAVWAYPLAGLAVGLPAAGVAALALGLGLTASLAAGLALAVLILLTGAMHEDGLADVADGFWGGFDRSRRLEIMKDSRIGAYGVLALILGQGLRWMALAAVLTGLGPLALIASCALSRSAMPMLMALLPGARDTGLSQAVGRPTLQHSLLGVALATLIALAFVGWNTLLLLPILALVAAGMALLARRKIGGQTGDVLGATQQICEIAALLVLAALSA